jgi:BMFP domain-containing protein YqiC
VEAPNRKNTNTDAGYLVDYNNMKDVYSTLNDTSKALAHYYASGIVKDFVSNWSFLVYNQLSLDVVALEGFDAVQSVKLFTASATAIVDADIQTLQNKQYYDVARPPLGMQCTFAGQNIVSWKGPHQGVGTIDGHDWKAWHTNVNNNGPEYPCQHCAQGGVAAQMFRLVFGGNDLYRGKNYTIAAGSFPQEPKILSGTGFIEGVTNVPNSGPGTIGYAPGSDVDIKWGTWTQYADDMAFSRIALGVHTLKSSRVGRKLGEDVATSVYNTLTTMELGGGACRNIGAGWGG